MNEQLGKQCVYLPIEIIQKKRRIMLREYDFPKIFQNVVGQVIPITLRNRQNRNKPLDFAYRLIQQLSSSSNSANYPQPPNGVLYVRSKKKKLVRRHKFNKTSSCFSMEQDKPEDKLSQNGLGTGRRNFLKRKQLTIQKTEKQYSGCEKDEIFQKNEMLDEDDQIRSNLAVAQGRANKRSNKGDRLKTSFEQAGFEMEKPRQKPFTVKHRTSETNPASRHTESMTVRTKPKHKTVFKYEAVSEERSHSKADEAKSIERKKSKKKTVGFACESEKENNEMLNQIVRRAPKMQKTIIQRFSGLDTNSRQPSPPILSNQQFEDEIASNWSARSVVSIKFTSNKVLNSKKTLRSQQSIFEGPNSKFLIKYSKMNHSHTRTYLKFTDRPAVSFKNYKSVTTLSEVSIDFKSEYSIARSKKTRKGTYKSNKSVTSSKKIAEKKGLKKQVSIIIKSNDNFMLADSLKTIIEPIKTSSIFQQLNFKKRPLLDKGSRVATDSDAFNELNNFHRFLNENSIQESEADFQGGLTKPIVIENSTHHRTISNPTALKQENLMMDMGLTLLKKMSVLRQRKL